MVISLIGNVVGERVNEMKGLGLEKFKTDGKRGSTPLGAAFAKISKIPNPGGGEAGGITFFKCFYGFLTRF